MEKVIIYQVLPRLYGNQVENPVNNGSIQQNGCGKFNDFTATRLKDIRELGFTHIWFTGVIEHATQTDYSAYGIAKDHPEVVKGKAGSPYAIKDYYDVDPDLAEVVENRMKEFQNLINRTHKAGLKVIMDFVPNHVARQYHSDSKPKGTKDLGEDDVTEVFFSNQNNFYYLPGEQFAPRFDLTKYADSPYIENPCKATGNDCFYSSPSQFDWYETVKLNYGVDYRNNRWCDFDPLPDTWLKMRDILLFWAKKKIDGFRCDMAEMVPAEFWNWAIPQVKSAYPDLIFIAETYDPSQYRHFIEYGKFDYLYDKVGLYDTLRSIMRNENSCHNITHCWQRVDGIKGHLLNFLENHDEQRVASPFFAGNADKGKPAMIVSSTINCGPIMVYAGQELGENAADSEGFSGADGRTTIFDYWTVPTLLRRLKGALTDEELALQAYYKTLLNVCRTERAISEGCLFDLEYANFNNPNFNTNKQYAYLRKAGSDLLIIAVNFEDFDVNLGLNIPQHAFEFLQLPSNQEFTAVELLTDVKQTVHLTPTEQLQVNVPKNGGVILKVNVE